MHVVRALNVNDAWSQLIELVHREGKWVDTRAGRALVVPVPVATVYRRPVERVLFDPVRDANPFFSFFEPLWMLAGRDDAQWLDRFVGNFSERFAEDGGRMHGAYGKRWRSWFDRVANVAERAAHGWPNVFTEPDTIDQLDECVKLLKENPLDRQAVIQMWDPGRDLGWKGLKDRPCNQQVLLRADRTRPSVIEYDHMTEEQRDKLRGIPERYLDITVTNRSNDLSWGLITANACQFSTLQEYLAARMGYEVGTYTQFSNNLHLYEAAMDKADLKSAEAHSRSMRVSQDYQGKYPGTRALVDEAEVFDRELEVFLADPVSDTVARFDNGFFYEVAQPMWRANEARLAKDWNAAMIFAHGVYAADWREATVAWITRRMK